MDNLFHELTSCGYDSIILDKCQVKEDAKEIKLDSRKMINELEKEDRRQPQAKKDIQSVQKLMSCWRVL
jgi:hypothetical protein